MTTCWFVRGVLCMFCFFGSFTRWRISYFEREQRTGLY